MLRSHATANGPRTGSLFCIALQAFSNCLAVSFGSSPSSLSASFCCSESRMHPCHAVDWHCATAASTRLRVSLIVFFVKTYTLPENKRCRQCSTNPARKPSLPSGSFGFLNFRHSLGGTSVICPSSSFGARTSYIGGSSLGNESSSLLFCRFAERWCNTPRCQNTVASSFCLQAY